MSVQTKRLIICLIASLLGAAGTAEVRAAAPAPDRPHPTGGTLVWGSVSPPVPFNPTKNINGVIMGLQDLVFNRLIRLNVRDEYEPDLARTWEISDDGLIYTFHLKEGIRFHDGKELTSDDVRFTYERILDPEQASPFRPDFQAVDRIETPDLYTVRFVLSKPDPLLFERFIMNILPRHLLTGEEVQQQKFYRNPVGTGPFRFQDWGEDQSSVVLAANTDYFEGRPYLDQIQVKVYPDNSALWKAFMRQDVDVVEFINYEDYLIASRDKDFRVYQSDWGMHSALLFDSEDETWRDLNLRRAVSLAINREQILYTLGLDESATEYNLDFNVGNTAVNFSPDEYDPARAAEMLELQGWHMMPTGIREKESAELELRILVDGRNATDTKLVRIIRQDLARIGIRTRVLLYEDNDELLQAADWDEPPQAWLRYLPDLDIYGMAVLDFWYSGSREPAEFCVYRNEKVDRLIEELYSMKDRDEQRRISREIYALINNDQPAVFLYYPKCYFAVNARLANTQDYFSFAQPSYTVKDWYVTSEDAQP